MSGLVVGKPKPFEQTDDLTGEITVYSDLLLKNEDPQFAAHRVRVTTEEFESCNVGDVVEFDVSISNSSYEGKSKLRIRALSNFKVIEYAV